MGIYHVVVIADDVMEMNKNRRKEVEAAIGEAVYTVCADPLYGYLSGPELERVTSHGVLNHGAAVRHAAELHRTYYEVFVFSSGALRPLSQLDKEELV